MEKKGINILLIVISLIFFGFEAVNPDKKHQSISKAKSFALVELFTSEGCSSCPPADAIFNDLVQKNDPNVFAIAYHIDYWDRLGWKDAFSKKEFTDRQNDYATYFKNNSVYTPQIIINGQNEFVGSSNDKLTNACKNYIKAENGIDLKSIIKNQKLNISFSITGSIEDKVLTLVLVQKTATVSVKRGENEGKKLLHTNIALSINYIALKNSLGSTNIDIPNKLLKEEYFILGFIQNKNNNKITGITRDL